MIYAIHLCKGDKYLACGHGSGAVTFFDLRNMETVNVERGRLRVEVGTPSLLLVPKQHEIDFQLYKLCSPNDNALVGHDGTVS